jgi:citronellol/citronellal dehydrogenase
LAADTDRHGCRADLLGGDEPMGAARTSDIVADAAYEIVTRPARGCTGNTFLDEEVLAESGVIDLARYRAGRGSEADLRLDFFL